MVLGTGVTFEGQKEEAGLGAKKKEEVDQMEGEEVVTDSLHAVFKRGFVLRLYHCAAQAES
jgi:hypothetical protein